MNLLWGSKVERNALSTLRIWAFPAWEGSCGKGMGINMKICRVEELKGNEVLDKPVMTSDYTILLASGTVLKPEYIEKLKDFEILEVAVREESADIQTIEILKSEVEEIFTVKVKEILEKHTYHHNENLMELCITADRIFSEIVSEENVIEQVFDIKERSSDIYEHSISLCTLATLTALKLKLPEDSIRSIGIGCLLHDIGLRYLTIPYENQDVSLLSDVEMAEYKKHTIYGYTALKNESWISDISKNIILYHHERLDGSGFPLKAASIPYECKIVNVCDAFDELICGVGCERVKVHEAVEYLKTFKNIKFDGTIVDVFLEFTAVYPADSQVMTNEGEVGVVIRQNKDFPNRPVLLMLYDKNGVKYEDRIIKDLMQENHIFIEKVLN